LVFALAFEQAHRFHALIGVEQRDHLVGAGADVQRGAGFAVVRVGHDVSFVVDAVRKRCDQGVTMNGSGLSG
jgi:hypothetical protein